MLRGLALLLALMLALAAPAGQAQDLQPIPARPVARVIDQTATLDDTQRAALEARLAAFEAQAGPQLVIFMVRSTAPEDIAAFAQRMGDLWKIGRRDVGDGLLIVVAKDDRRIWIAPAKALEGAVPDLAARQIVQNLITPAFKQGDFAAGLTAGVDALIARIQGEALPPPRPGPRGPAGAFDGVDWQQGLMFFFVGVTVVGAALKRVFGRALGSLLTGGAAGALGWWFTHSLLLAGAAGVLTLVVVGVLGVGTALNVLGRGRGPGGWSGGGGFGGGSPGGGGFSSGGGGDFGGGGAGGRW